MANLFKHFHVHHFRSIRDCSLTGLRQVNVIIGAPNTGKTNLIDALSLFCIPEIAGKQGLRLRNLTRVQRPEELFFVRNAKSYASVTSDRSECSLTHDVVSGLAAQLAFDASPEDSLNYNVDHEFSVHARHDKTVQPLVRRYQFDTGTVYKSDSRDDLATPTGYNLFNLLSRRPEVREELTALFRNVGFQRSDEPLLKAHRKGDGRKVVFSACHHGDTVQRLMMYLTAIGTNKGKALLFDNIDAHIHPSSFVHLAAAMIYDSGNQYFLSMHNSFLLYDLLDGNSWDHLAIFNVYLKNDETHVYRLTDDDMRDIFYDGVDAFTNNKRFVDEDDRAV